jgi:hypothetical protein
MNIVINILAYKQFQVKRFQLQIMDLVEHYNFDLGCVSIHRYNVSIMLSFIGII